MADVEALARQLYARDTRSAPTWEQLGPGTRQAWLKMAERHAAGDPDWCLLFPRAKPLTTTAPAQPQGELF